jgi:predicted lysophospholipase L1 biosynthesis ABC-type transport system permease subunit
MLDQVVEATGSRPQSLDDLRDDIGTAAGAAQARAYVLTAGACVLVALLGLAAGVARHRRSYRHDVAALRVMGIGVDTARRAGRTELAALALLVVGAVAVGGWVVVQLLLGGLPLITPSPAAQPLDTGARASALALPAVLAAVAVLVVGGRARAVRDSTTRPSLLRDEERR